MNRYQVTVRHTNRFQRYHVFSVDAADVADALRQAADSVPPEILPYADLVELRVAVDPDERAESTLG